MAIAKLIIIIYTKRKENYFYTTSTNFCTKIKQKQMLKKNKTPNK